MSRETGARIDDLGQRRNAGRVIAVLREDRGLGLRELARAAGTDATFLQRIERGEASVTPETAAKLAAGFELTGLELEWFMAEVAPPAVPKAVMHGQLMLLGLDIDDDKGEDVHLARILVIEGATGYQRLAAGILQRAIADLTDREVSHADRDDARAWLVSDECRDLLMQLAPDGYDIDRLMGHLAALAYPPAAATGPDTARPALRLVA